MQPSIGFSCLILSVFTDGGDIWDNDKAIQPDTEHGAGHTNQATEQSKSVVEKNMFFIYSKGRARKQMQLWKQRQPSYTMAVRAHRRERYVTNRDPLWLLCCSYQLLINYIRSAPAIFLYCKTKLRLRIKAWGHLGGAAASLIGPKISARPDVSWRQRDFSQGSSNKHF